MTTERAGLREPRTAHGTFLRDGLLALGFDDESANESIVAIEDEATTPDEPVAGLDVERLRRVISYTGDGDGAGYSGDFLDNYAANIAAEYARLREDVP